MKVKEESEKVGLKVNIQKTKIMESGPITSWQIDGEKWKIWGVLKSLQMVTIAMNLKDTCSLEDTCSYDKLRQCIKKLSHHFAGKGLYSQSYGFTVFMYGR